MAASSGCPFDMAYISMSLKQGGMEGRYGSLQDFSEALDQGIATIREISRCGHLRCSCSYSWKPRYVVFRSSEMIVGLFTSS